MPFTEVSIFRISSSRWASSVCSNLLYAIYFYLLYELTFEYFHAGHVDFSAFE